MREMWWQVVDAGDLTVEQLIAHLNTIPGVDSVQAISGMRFLSSICD
jgi:hypothetical protein